MYIDTLMTNESVLMRGSNQKSFHFLLCQLGQTHSSPWTSIVAAGGSLSSSCSIQQAIVDTQSSIPQYSGFTCFSGQITVTNIIFIKRISLDIVDSLKIVDIFLLTNKSTILRVNCIWSKLKAIVEVYEANNLYFWTKFDKACKVPNSNKSWGAFESLGK